MLGVAFLLMYHTWSASWQVTITILGWLVLARGVIALFSPDIVKKAAAKIKNQKDIVSFVFVGCVILGCVLIYFGNSI